MANIPVRKKADFTMIKRNRRESLLFPLIGCAENCRVPTIGEIQGAPRIGSWPHIHWQGGQIAPSSRVLLKAHFFFFSFSFWPDGTAVFPTPPIVVIIAVCGSTPFVESQTDQVASNSA
ncbi:MAG: hypothetical protein WCD24_20870 [Serratia inhibens]|uniref:hypothetical protein n=1 Tax=Serratia inhibens TaxID=2338073 RepID=UPI003C7AACB9